MTYNVRSFFGESGASNVDDIVRLIGEYDPDIVCMQEFNARLAEKSDDFALLDEKYESAAFGRTQAPDFWDDPEKAEKQLKKVAGIKYWITAYDAGCLVRENGTYDLTAIPSLYLLDSDKRVLVKDSTDVPYIEEVIDRRG